MGSFQTPASPSPVTQPASVSASDTFIYLSQVCSVYVASTFLCVDFHCTLQLAIVAVCTVYITTTLCLSKVCISILYQLYNFPFIFWSPQLLSHSLVYNTHTYIHTACDCDPRGTVGEVCRLGVLGECPCKSNTESQTCTMCKDGFFGLDATNPDGCSGDTKHASHDLT